MTTALSRMKYFVLIEARGESASNRFRDTGTNVRTTFNIITIKCQKISLCFSKENLLNRTKSTQKYPVISIKELSSRMTLGPDAFP